MHIEIKRTPEALNQRDDPATGTAFPCLPGTPDQRRFDRAGDDRNDSGHRFRARRQQKYALPALVKGPSRVSAGTPSTVWTLERLAMLFPSRSKERPQGRRSWARSVYCSAPL
jgi:hypothetical protein